MTIVGHNYSYVFNFEQVSNNFHTSSYPPLKNIGVTASLIFISDHFQISQSPPALAVRICVNYVLAEPPVNAELNGKLIGCDKVLIFPSTLSGFRALRRPGLDGGELEVRLCLGQRDIHAPHLRGPNLHGQQVGLGWLGVENLHFNKRRSFLE